MRAKLPKSVLLLFATISLLDSAYNYNDSFLEMFQIQISKVFYVAKLFYYNYFFWQNV